MSDSRDARNIFGDAEPPRDARLGALIGEGIGPVPFDDVDWTALSARLSAARPRPRMTWWGYAARWERRAVPVALAAGLAGALALWGLGMPSSGRATGAVPATEAVAALMDGAPADDVARSWARDVTSADELAGAEVY